MLPIFPCLRFLPHSGDVRMDYYCWWVLSVRVMCTSTARNKTDRCTRADVPNFAEYCCNVRCIRDSCTLFLLCGKLSSCPSPELGWDHKPSICYRSQEYCIRDCSAAGIAQCYSGDLAEPFASQKALKLLLRCTNKMLFLDFLTHPSTEKGSAMYRTGWLVRSRLGGGRFRITTAKKLEKGIKL